MRSERLTLTFLTKASPLGDLTYWFSFPSGHTLSIETGISRLLALEPLFCALPMGAWLPLVTGSLTDVISVLLGTLALMGTMHPLVKHRTAVLVLISNKSRSQCTMCVQRGLKTNMLHIQVEKLWEGMSM